MCHALFTRTRLPKLLKFRRKISETADDASSGVQLSAHARGSVSMRGCGPTQAETPAKAARQKPTVGLPRPALTREWGPGLEDKRRSGDPQIKGDFCCKRGHSAILPSNQILLRARSARCARGVLNP
jgi:hypothetical protein